MSNMVTLSIIFLLFLLITLFWYQLSGLCTEESMAASAITIMAVTFCQGLRKCEVCIPGIGNSFDSWNRIIF